MKLAVVLGVCVVGILVIVYFYKGYNYHPMDAHSRVSVHNKDELINRKVTSGIVYSSADRAADIKDKLREIENFSSNVGRGDVSYLMAEVDIFNEAAPYTKPTDTAGKEEKKYCAQLKKKLQALQIKEFPKLRKDWIEYSKNLLWKHNIDVSSLGNKNKNVLFVGGYFADNANIQQTYEQLRPALAKLRFKRIVFRWYKDADDGTQYVMYTDSDDAIIE
jgi:hypothetical protein